MSSVEQLQQQQQQQQQQRNQQRAKNVSSARIRATKEYLMPGKVCKTTLTTTCHANNSGSDTNNGQPTTKMSNLKSSNATSSHHQHSKHAINANNNNNNTSNRYKSVFWKTIRRLVLFIWLGFVFWQTLLYSCIVVYELFYFFSYIFFLSVILACEKKWQMTKYDTPTQPKRHPVMRAPRACRNRIYFLLS